MVYTLLATQVPTPVVPAALLSIAGATPTTFTALVAAASGSGSLVTPANKNFTRGDVIGRAGGGAFAVDWDSGSGGLPGLNLTTTGALNVTVGVGQAMLDGPVQIESPYTVPGITDNVARIHLWMNQAGVVTPVNNSLTPPAGIQCYVGSVVTAGGVVTELNGSGVLYLMGSQLLRRTADIARPTDTPPAGLSYFVRGLYSTYFWNGLEYLELSPGAPLADTVVASGTTLTIPSGKQLVIAELDVQGTLVVGGRLAMVS
jgi:hypothetical protein